MLNLIQKNIGEVKINKLLSNCPTTSSKKIVLKLFYNYFKEKNCVTISCTSKNAFKQSQNSLLLKLKQD